MKLLKKEKVWTGDGLGAASAVLLKQVKRTEINHKFPSAIYERIKINNNRAEGYEVFIIKTIEAGTPGPGGIKTKETYEQYPTADSFGRIAWSVGTLRRAEEIYNNLIKGIKPNCIL
jgi:hypothetical protein